MHWDNPEGWYGEGGGRRIQNGEHMYTCGGLNFYFFKKKSIKEIEKASDIGIRRGQKEHPLASVSNGIIYSLISYYSESKESLEVKTSLDLLL